MVGERRPDRDPQESDRAENAAQRQARRRLRGEPPATSRASVSSPTRQRADHERRRLRSRVAAARDDQRHEQREHHGARDLLLEESHRGRRQHLAEEQHHQPAGALLTIADGESPCTARRALPIRRTAGISRVAAASATSSTSSTVTMPISTPAVSVTGSAVRSSRRNTSTAASWVSVAFSVTNRRSIRSETRAGQRHDQEFANADVVDQYAVRRRRRR